MIVGSKTRWATLLLSLALVACGTSSQGGPSDDGSDGTDAADASVDGPGDADVDPAEDVVDAVADPVDAVEDATTEPDVASDSSADSMDGDESDDDGDALTDPEPMDASDTIEMDAADVQDGSDVSDTADAQDVDAVADVTMDSDAGDAADGMDTSPDADPPTCDELGARYERLIAEAGSCVGDEMCQLISGACGVGLGGCYHAVNESYASDEAQAVVEAWTAMDCGAELGICRCAPPPPVACEMGTCVLQP